MKYSDFVSELLKKIKNNNIKLTKDELVIIITEFVSLIHNEVLYKNEKIKINNFAVFELGKKAPRKLPGGKIVEKGDIIRVRLSKNFKNKEE